MTPLDQLLSQSRSHFQSKDYEGCMNLVAQVLSDDPDNTEAAWLMKEAQRQWEEQRSMEEFEIYVENLKKEAMDLFDQEQYEQCLGTFRFLLELDPENHTLRDYVKLSQELFLERLEKRSPEVEPGGTSLQTETKPEEPRAAERVVTPPNDVPPSKPAPLSPLPEPPELPAAAGLSLRARRGQASFETSRQQSEDRSNTSSSRSRSESISQAQEQKIIEEYLTSTAPLRQRKRVAAWLTAAALLLALILAARGWLYPLLNVTNSLDIQSKPAGASVFINNELKGETHFHQENLPPGSYELRFEMAGYAPYHQRLVLEKAQTAWFFVHLEKSRLEGSTVEPEKITQVGPPEPPSNDLPPDVLSRPTALLEPQSPVRDEVACSVIHLHVLGSCTGRLKVSGSIISFRPSGNSKDGFTRKTTQIETVTLDETLTIQFDDKNYRFDPLARNSEELTTLYQRVRGQTAEAKP
jgi:tetratricopeptide (TPR) repeat protein